MPLPRISLSTLALCAGLFASPALAQAINGQYDAYSCHSGPISDSVLRITWPTLSFHESTCTISESIAGAENTYLMHCSGEGEYWASQIRITPQVGGDLVINIRGSDTVFRRCN
ncbi:hypothetical protein [Pararhodobacter oceanensis]|uniref:hypothetical protein n=1 Tax=Pararhodobacter oceanensis TaxID=2172121 RepID=UPI003A902750